MLLLLAPIIFWYTGVSALAARGDDALLVIVPRFVAAYVLTYWLSLRKVMPPITMIHKALPAFHLTAAIFIALVRPFGRPFSVTAKGQPRDRVVVQWSFLWIFVGLAAALLAGMAMSLLGFYEVVEVGAFTALDVFWSVFSLAVLLTCALVCVELPKKANEPDFEAEAACPLRTTKAVASRFLSQAHRFVVDGGGPGRGVRPRRRVYGRSVRDGSPMARAVQDRALHLPGRGGRLSMTGRVLGFAGHAIRR